MRVCREMEDFVRISLETHLFFARIMKEHSLFLEAGFMRKDLLWIRKAAFFRREFEDFLRDVVRISDRVVSGSVVSSGELVTSFTEEAEKETSNLSGIPIDSTITRMEERLNSGREVCECREMMRTVRRLNERALRLLDGLIGFKENILQEVGECRLFTANYPLLVRHILREANLYRDTVRELMEGREDLFQNLRRTEEFWNQIMMEHAMFIRGLLDPSEEELVRTANRFAMNYRELLETAKRQDFRAMNGLREKSLEETRKLREFKTAGTQGILECKIESIILPLLADHVLREANHYIRILEKGYTWMEK